MIPKLKKPSIPTEPPTKGRLTSLPVPSKIIFDGTRTHVTRVHSKFYCNIGLIKIYFTQASNSKPDLDSKIGYGTGTLIASNIVLTCAHNLDVKGQEGISVQKMTFSPGVTAKEDEDVEAIAVSKSIFYPEYKNIKGEVETLGTDIAILVLERPVEGLDQFVAYKVMSDDELEGLWVTIAGYPGVFSKKEEYLAEIQKAGRDVDVNAEFVPFMMKMSGKIVKTQNRILRYRVKTSEGQSGSAIVHSLSESEFILVGIHNAGRKNESRLGSRITQAVYDWIETVRRDHEIKQDTPKLVEQTRARILGRLYELNLKASESFNIRNEEYMSTYLIGSGGQGDVVRADNGNPYYKYARKIVTFAGNPLRELSALQEVEILMKLMEHQKQTEDPSKDLLYIYNINYVPGQYFEAMMELGEGTLDTLVRFTEHEGHPFKKKEVENIFIHLCSQIIRLRALGIYHRDIKPSNVVVTNDMHLKLTDFGISEIIEKGKSEKGRFAACGTDGYCPDAVQKALDAGDEFVELDIWEGEVESLRKMMKKLFGKYEFDFQDIEKIEVKDYNPKLLKDIIPEAARQIRIFKGTIYPDSLNKRYMTYHFENLFEKNDHFDLSPFLNINNNDLTNSVWIEILQSKIDDYPKPIKIQIKNACIDYHRACFTYHEGLKYNQEFYEKYGIETFEEELDFLRTEIEMLMLSGYSPKYQGMMTQVSIEELNPWSKAKELCKKAIEIALQNLGEEDILTEEFQLKLDRIEKELLKSQLNGNNLEYGNFMTQYLAMNEKSDSQHIGTILNGNFIEQSDYDDEFLTKKENNIDWKSLEESCTLLNKKRAFEVLDVVGIFSLSDEEIEKIFKMMLALGEKLLEKTEFENGLDCFLFCSKLSDFFSIRIPSIEPANIKMKISSVYDMIGEREEARRYKKYAKNIQGSSENIIEDSKLIEWAELKVSSPGLSNAEIFEVLDNINPDRLSEEDRQKLYNMLLEVGEKSMEKEEFDNALNCFLQSMTVFEQIYSIKPKDQAMKTKQNLMRISDAFQLVGNQKKALEYMQKAESTNYEYELFENDEEEKKPIDWDFLKEVCAELSPIEAYKILDDIEVYLLDIEQSEKLYQMNLDLGEKFKANEEYEHELDCVLKCRHILKLQFPIENEESREKLRLILTRISKLYELLGDEENAREYAEEAENPE